MNKKEFLRKLLYDKKFEEKAVEANLKELKKQVRKGDVEKIEEIVDFLLDIKGLDKSDEPDMEKVINNFHTREKKDSIHVHTNSSIKKRVAAAVVPVMVLLATNGIVQAATNENLFTLAVNIKEGGFSLDTGNTIELPVSEDDPYGIKGVCQTYGYTPDTPFYLPEGFMLKHMGDSTNDPDCIYNSFTFKKGKASIHFSYMYYYDKIKPMDVPCNEFNLSEIEVNGAKAVLSQEDGQYVVNYQKGKILYTVFIQHVDYSECEKIIKSIE